MATAPMFMPKMSGGPEEHVKFSLLIVKQLINFKMKKINKLGLIFTLIMIFMSCEELPDPAGLRGKAVVPAITNINRVAAIKCTCIPERNDFITSVLKYIGCKLNNFQLR